ncbi:hypothetical protein [Bradyrhizobium sp. Ai1a-2]|uniref:hypothetical protein n=1 Tax=Bradyrhizobium sp. Ai1a-2 TaxID=196490 RepID=UPI0012686D3A|nr:hypothetical protein [Bradyrhizobium sp. Ai1a-2]
MIRNFLIREAEDLEWCAEQRTAQHKVDAAAHLTKLAADIRALRRSILHRQVTDAAEACAAEGAMRTFVTRWPARRLGVGISISPSGEEWLRDMLDALGEARRITRAEAVAAQMEAATVAAMAAVEGALEQLNDRHRAAILGGALQRSMPVAKRK